MNQSQWQAVWQRVLGLCLGALMVVLGTSGATAAPQNSYRQEFGGPDGSIGRQLSWRRALQVERQRPVIEAWAEAGLKGRERLVQALDEGVDPRRSRRRLLPMEFLSRAWRNERHVGEDAARKPWLDLVDSVDPRVIPGAFNARTEGRGEAMTVRLTSIWNSLVDETEDISVEVRLIWSSPAGEEIVARREVADAVHMEEGFDMYIRPPISEPGVWGLTLEMDTPAGLVRSGTVPVECVRDLPGLNERLAKDAGSALARDLRSRLDLLLGYGIRVASGSAIGAWVRALDSSQLGELGLNAIDGAEVGVPDEVFWQLRESETTQGVLLILTNENESPVDLFNGPRLAAWRELAKTCGLRIVAGNVPLTITSAEPLARCLAQIKTNWPGPIYLLGRGQTGQLSPSLIGKNPDLPLDALILSEILGAGGRLPDGVPCPALQVVSGLFTLASEASEAGEGMGRRTRMLLPAQDPVAAYQATEIIKNWIQSL